MRALRKRRLLLDTLTILATALSAAMVRAFTVAPTPPRRPPPLLPLEKVNSAFNCQHSLLPRCRGAAKDCDPRTSPSSREYSCCGRRPAVFRLEASRLAGGLSSCAMERGSAFGGGGVGGRSALLAATITDHVACASVSGKSGSTGATQANKALGDKVRKGRARMAKAVPGEQPFQPKEALKPTAAAAAVVAATATALPVVRIQIDDKTERALKTQKTATKSSIASPATESPLTERIPKETPRTAALERRQSKRQLAAATATVVATEPSSEKQEGKKPGSESSSSVSPPSKRRANSPTPSSKAEQDAVIAKRRAKKSKAVQSSVAQTKAVQNKLAQKRAAQQRKKETAMIYTQQQQQLQGSEGGIDEPAVPELGKEARPRAEDWLIGGLEASGGQPCAGNSRPLGGQKEEKKLLQTEEEDLAVRVDQEGEGEGGEGRGRKGEGWGDGGVRVEKGKDSDNAATNGERKRMSRRYWEQIQNVRKELTLFWEELGIKSDKIPNHTIMQYFRAHGIRHAIARQGGCECTAEWLGVEVIPGKWSEALHAEEIRQLISNGKLGGDVIGPRKGATHLVGKSRERWPSHRSLAEGFQASALKPDKNKRNYWTDATKLFNEMVAFSGEYQGKLNLPLVWMPRSICMNKAGRRDLVNAITRAGGYDSVVQRAGMVHACEWRTFMDQLQTLRELRDYLTVDGELTNIMPTRAKLKAADREELYKRISLMGGLRKLSRKMGLVYPRTKKMFKDDGLRFGRFDLGFAVDLLEYIFKSECQRIPQPEVCKKSQARKTKRKERRGGLRGIGGIEGMLGVAAYGMTDLRGYNAAIMLPRRKDLLRDGEVGKDLQNKIEYYGGYEHVARRLNLGYSYDDELAYQAKLSKLFEGKYKAEFDKRMDVAKQQIQAGQDLELASEEQKQAELRIAKANARREKRQEAEAGRQGKESEKLRRQWKALKQLDSMPAFHKHGPRER